MADQTGAALPEGKMPELRVMPMPADANVHGDVFGGWIMAQVDIAGSLPAVRRANGRVMEMLHYRVRADERATYLEAMEEVRLVRGRTGALFWQLYEDVAHADCWLEVWSVESWTGHLRESARTSDADRGVLARALAFHRDPPPAPSRFIAVAPHRLPPARALQITG